jgi:predicted  nucleic acid-binding Zn-ribbon protein
VGRKKRTIKEGFLQQILNNLMVLQRLDSQRAQLESLRGDLPQQVNRLKNEIEEIEQSIKNTQEKLRSYEKERGITEMEIKALEGKKKKYQAQLFQVKNNREYDAVTFEIEAVNAEVEKKENRILEILDMEEELKKSLETDKEEFNKLNGRLENVSKELKGQIAKTEKDEVLLTHEREKVVHKLESRYLASYERIRKAKNGLAVVPVVRGACGGCFKSLPPQKILEIRQMNRLYLCEVCGRILIWDDKESGEPE